jgi:hypothetical protein
MQAHVDDRHADGAWIEDPSLKSQARTFLMTLLVISAVMWALPWGLMRLPRFLVWSGTYFGSMLEYSFVASSTGTNADVVIFGDSSALFGIDPLLMSAETGLKVVNLPNAISSLPVTDDMALQRYLEHNAPPRLLVFYFAPWNLDYRNVSSTQALYEGEQMLARHGSLGQLLAFARSHPSEAGLFPFRFYSINSLTVFLSHLRRWHEDPPIVRSMGHADLVLATSKLLKPSCRFPEKLLHQSQVDSALDLAKKYGDRATAVMFYIAPVPHCENAELLKAGPYSELSAAPPQEMEPNLYDDDGYFIHLDHRGVPPATNQLVTAVQAALRPDHINPFPTSANQWEPNQAVRRPP